MDPIQQLHSLGQSLWYDNIQRRLLAKSPKGENGELAALIERGEIRGVTSNPSIFHNAIAKTNDYDSALIPMAWAGWEAETIFWQLAIEDITRACDLFRPLYEQTKGGDGYVSLEVHPALAHNTEATLAQAKHLWERVDRPNLMIKIPATPEGLPAIRGAIAAGINVNVTLIFSIERYRAVMEAYLSGLEDLLFPSPLGGGARGGVPASVASFFVSRMDTKVDARLPEGSPLRGKSAIVNAKLAYEVFLQTFTGARWVKLAKAGARLQRPLWASTSTKNPAYPDTIYVDELIGAATVNTIPPQTLDAFRDHGRVEQTLTRGLDGARQVIGDLDALGIHMAQVTQELEDEGVQSFTDAFTDLLKTIDERRQSAVAQLGPLAAPVSRRVAHLIANAVPDRLWAHDPTLWASDAQAQDEIRQRLGWLNLPETSRAALKEINDFTAEICASGIDRCLLLGMGGSSLAPEVLSLVFSPPLQGGAGGGSAFAILDSTDPTQVLAAAREYPPQNTLYIVSSKSGDTIEVKALQAYFWALAEKELGPDTGSHFVAITDPGTSLAALANARGFRKTFLADPTVGGRNSALGHFGLVPAALMGIDLAQLLDHAARMMAQCKSDVTGARNPGLVLGAILGQAAIDGRDKLTLIADGPLAPFGAWLEQLVAESSGKAGQGIVVIDGEPLGDPTDYGGDRLFVYLRQSGEMAEKVSELRKAGHPAIEFLIPDPYSLISEFYRWEVAISVACHILGVNAFDQPDVQDNKARTKNKLDAYRHHNRLPEADPAWEKDGLKVFSPTPVAGSGLAEVLYGFLATAREHDYVAINAYLPRNAEMTEILQKLRLAIRKQTGCATTVGFGPRFLHSTGQLHKGGPRTGLFLQITAEPIEDVEIPGQGMNFGTLERAQALGDYDALTARIQRIMRIHLLSLEKVVELITAIYSTSSPVNLANKR